MRCRLEGFRRVSDAALAAALAAALLVLLGGCNTASITEQRRESIDRHLGEIHHLQFEEMSESGMKFSSVRPVFCVTDEVQALASPVFATSGQRTAQLLEHSADMLRICQGCAVKAAGVALWQPDVAPALVRHRREVFKIDSQVIYDTDLQCDERYRTKEVPSGLSYSGTAVPITEDGYFLTAAHVVDTAPKKPKGGPDGGSGDDSANSLNDSAQARALAAEDFHVACLTSDGKPTLARARIVWSSAVGTFGRRSPHLSDAVPDFAIFHADIRPAKIASFAEPTEAKSDVLVVGGRALQFSDFSDSTFAHCAGRIVEVEALAWDGYVYQRLRTTAPAAPGDSGGPILTGRGRLVGIATNNGQELSGRWVSWAWMLPEAEIRAIVEADRQLQAGK